MKRLPSLFFFLSVPTQTKYYLAPPVFQVRKLLHPSLRFFLLIRVPQSSTPPHQQCTPNKDLSFNRFFFKLLLQMYSQFLSLRFS